MDDFDVAPDTIGESAQRVMNRAVEESRRREHATVAIEHLFFALTQVEWDTFCYVMQDLEINPHVILDALDEHLQRLPTRSGCELRVAPNTKTVFQLAFNRASRDGRTIASSDLFSAILEESHGVPLSIVRRQGVPPSTFVARLTTQMRDHELREGRLRKRLELPEALHPFATNLNLLARQNKIPSVHGRDHEMQQVLEILCHRGRSNSVMLIGEPGVGKTAIVEGLARRLEFEPQSVPTRLRDYQVVSLQMNSLVGGTMLRGMFEERIQNVIRAVQDHPNLILFVDEAHTLIGAGSALGAPADAANAFKSVLARGEVRMIGATTLGEYKEYIQEDAALARRFRTVQVAEPSLDESRRILYSLRPQFERNHAVRLTNEAIETALEMSPRYQRHLHLPDKVIGWLETAAVRAEIERRGQVTPPDVIAVISDAAQIPKDMVFRDVGDRFKDIELCLSRRVVGQKPAVQALAHRLMLNKGPLKDGFDRPDGVLLFVGPTGVGKTELAKAVAEFLFGDEKRMIRIDMSEYQDGGVSVDKLIGAPRGIVGSERGGVLTNQLRDTPCSVVLLDEIEKASPNVLNLFLQAFDEGWLTDGRGRRAYLSDAIVIMTSNVGSEHVRKLTNPLGFGTTSADQITTEIDRELERRFPPEFRNRIDGIVVFAPLTKTEAREIALTYLGQVKATLARHGKTLTVAPHALEKIVDQGYSLAYGARFLKRFIDDVVKLPISQRWKEAIHFRATVKDDRVAIETTDYRLTAAVSQGAIAV